MADSVGIHGKTRGLWIFYKYSDRFNIRKVTISGNIIRIIFSYFNKGIRIHPCNACEFKDRLSDPSSVCSSCNPSNTIYLRVSLFNLLKVFRESEV